MSKLAQAGDSSTVSPALACSKAVVRSLAWFWYLTFSCGSVLRVRLQGEEVFEDDFTGQLLPPDLAKNAQKMELEYFDGK